MFKLLLKFAPALEAGKELKNPALWKNAQDTVNRVYVVLLFVVAAIRMQWPDMMPVSDEELLSAAFWITTGLSGMNSFFTKATSKKVGVKNG